MDRIVYFSIGEAVAVIAIILAFTQLETPVFRFRARIQWFKLKSSYALLILGVILPFLASTLPFIIPREYSLLSMAFFWEIIAGSLIVLGVFSFLEINYRPVTFTRRNSSKYFYACASIIARGDERSLGALAEEVCNSAQSITKVCGEYNKFKEMEAQEMGKEYIVPEHMKYAFSLLDLLSDKKFTRTLVVSAPSTAIEFIEQIKENTIHNTAGYSFVQQIIHQAFLEEESIFHREEEYYGLGHFSSFTETVFGDYNFIQSDYRPLQAWLLYKDQYLKINILKKYSKALLTATKAYLNTKKYRDTSALYVGISTLARSAMFYISRLKKMPSEDILSSEEHDALREIAETFKSLLKLTEELEDNIPEYEFNEERYDRFKDTSIYGILGYGIYEFMSMLSVDLKHDEDIRFLAIDLWLDIVPVSERLETKI
jgi:hypothetical protein